jgi:hypothetical protein
MNITNTRSITGPSNSALGSAVGVSSNSLSDLKLVTAAQDKAFGHVFLKGGLRGDWDGDWCPTKPKPEPQPTVDVFPPQIR